MDGRWINADHSSKGHPWFFSSFVFFWWGWKQHMEEVAAVIEFAAGKRPRQCLICRQQAGQMDGRTDRWMGRQRPISSLDPSALKTLGGILSRRSMIWSFTLEWSLQKITASLLVGNWELQRTAANCCSCWRASHLKVLHSWMNFLSVCQVLETWPVTVITLSILQYYCIIFRYRAHLNISPTHINWQWSWIHTYISRIEYKSQTPSVT